jgi:hypothetical protein
MCFTHAAHRLLLSVTLLVGALLASPVLTAATVVGFDFESPPPGATLPTPPSLVAAHLTVSDFGALFDIRNDFVGNLAGLAFGATSHWVNLGDNRLFFEIAVADGYALSLDGFAFDERANSGSATMNTGPTAWQLFVFDALTPAATGVADNPWEPRMSGELALTGLTGIVQVFLFASGAGNDAGRNPGTWRLDNFELSGNVTPQLSQVPVPAAGLLLLSGSLLLTGLRRLRT